MDIDQIFPWLAATSFALSIITVVAAWINSPTRALAADVARQKDEVDKRMDRHRNDLVTHDRRIQSLEGSIQHLPGREDLHAIEMQLTALSTIMAALQKTVGRIDDHLRSEK